MHKHHSAGVTHLWNMFWQKPFSHGNNNIWFEARRVANINLRISLFSTTNDKPHQIDSFFGGAWHLLTTQIGTFYEAPIELVPSPAPWSPDWCAATSTSPPQPSPPATDLFCLLIDHDNAQRSLVLNHNAFLIFIIISLFLPSHSYALTSFFLVFYFLSPSTTSTAWH